MKTTTQAKQVSDEAKIRALTEQWRSLWSPKDQPFTGKGLENIFATGQNEILVRTYAKTIGIVEDFN